jgi:hypothetical protein
VELKYLVWLWLSLPLVGAYPTFKGVVEIYKELKEEEQWELPRFLRKSKLSKKR